MPTLGPAAATATAPSITTQPVSQTVTAGQTGTFFVVATGTGTLTYQWMKGTAAISNATSASYTTPVTTTADSGSMFSVVVKNSAGSTTSSSAMLTVNAAAVPDFSLSASPYTLTQGGNGSSTITVTPQNGFNGSVMLSASNLPTGVTGSFNPASATTSSSLTLAASSAAATGNFSATITGTSGSLSHTATLNLTVNAVGGKSTLTANPTSLSFTYQVGGTLPRHQTLAITSTGGPTPYTATVSDPWLRITPTSGTTGTSGNIRVSVNPAGMAPGTYNAQINIPGIAIPVYVHLTINPGSGGGGTTSSMNAQPSVSDPQSGTLAAAWVDNLGATPHNPSDPTNRGLVLAKNASASSSSWAGATIQNVTGMSLTVVGFDYLAGIPCSAGLPHFVVVTTDQVMHTVGGCSSSAAVPQSSTPMGWTRLWFDPTQASPPISSGSPVQSISIVLDKGTTQTGSTPTGSIVVIDNIYINNAFVGKGTTAPPTTPPPPPPTPRDD